MINLNEAITQPFTSESSLVSYDTVKICLYQSQVSDICLFEDIPPFVEMKGSSNDKDGNLFMKRGHIRNFIVRIYQDKIQLEGSLSKYYKGSNLTGITLDKVRQVIDSLSEILHLPLYMAHVLRIDIAYNIEVTRDVKQYLKRLRRCGKLERLEQPYSLRYGNSSSVRLCIYDKIKQLRHDREPYDCSDAKNIFRFELRFFRNANNWRRFWGSETVAVEMIWDDKFFRKLTEMLYQKYQSIEKLYETSLNFAGVTGKKDFKNWLSLYAVQSQGYDFFQRQIEDARVSRQFSNKQAASCRTVLREILGAGVPSPFGSGYIEELDAAFERLRDLYDF